MLPGLGFIRGERPNQGYLMSTSEDGRSAAVAVAVTAMLETRTQLSTGQVCLRRRQIRATYLELLDPHAPETNE